MENKFTEEDKKKFVDFLNMVAKHAKFELTTPEIIGYYHLLAHMQKSILPKIDANVFEIKKIIEGQSEEPKGSE